MAIGRISGPLLKENLTRDGVNLRFEDDLLYLKVTDPNSANHRIGIKNSNPAYTLDITGTARATTLLGGELDIDEIYINDNTISSQIGDLILNAATNLDKVTINNDVLINGNLHATGSITADGSLQLGDANTDNVVFGADVNSNIMPNITDTYILGGTDKRWLNGNFRFLEIGELYLSNNTVTSSTTNGDLYLTGNGTGVVIINNALTVGASGSISMPGNFSVGGTLTVTGDIVGGPLRTDDIQIVGNRIETTSSNSNFEINTVGTGSIELLANSNVTGTFGVSSLATLAQARVSDLTSGRVTLAGASGRLQDNANLTFNGTTLTVTGDETVTGTSTTNTLVVNGSSTLTGPLTTSNNVNITGTLTVTGDIVGGPLVTDDIRIAGNRIETTSSNSNLELNTVGTGTIELQTNTNVTGTLGVNGTVNATNISSTGQVTFATGASGSVASFGTANNRVWINGGSANNTIYSENNQLQIAPGGLNWSTQGALFTTTSLTVNYTTASTSSTDGALKVAGGAGIAGNLNVGGTLGVSGLSTLAQAQVSDLTSGRVTFAGTSGRLQDSSALTFSNGTLTVGTSVVVSGTGGDITMTGGNITGVGNISTGGLAVSNNATISGTLTVTGDIVGGPLRTDDIQIVGNRIETTSSNSNFEINTVGTGSIELLADTNVTGALDVSSQATLASANVEDLTSGRIVLAGTNGELEDSANLTFDGTTVSVTGNISVTGGTTSTINGITITGTTLDSTDSSGITFTPLVTFSSDASVENNLYVRNQITTENMIVEGNLTVLGTETVINSTTFSITDGLIYLGEDNQSDVIDLGFIASYNDGTYQHTGFVRDATDGKWKLFESVVDEPSLTVNFNQATYSILKLGTLEADSILNSNLTSGRVVLAGTNGELEDSPNLTFNGTTLTVTGDQHITGDLEVDGDITLGGNIRIGNQDIDTVTVVADFTSDLLPNQSDTYDLGRTNKAWRTVYASEFDNGVIKINDNTIKTTVSNADLELFANGSGQVRINGYKVSIGYNAGLTNQDTNGVSIGAQAGQTNQGQYGVSVGSQAGQNDQGSSAVAIGSSAGWTTQASHAVSIGSSAGYSNQGSTAVAIGGSAGSNNQGNYGIAIGGNAGQISQGTNAIAIGRLAGQTSQSANSIILNASGVTLNGTAAGLYVSPVRNLDTGLLLRYNATTKEITYSTDDITIGSISIENNVIRTIVSNANLELDANGTGIVLIPNSDVTIEQNLLVNSTSAFNDVVVNGILTANDPSTFNDTVDINSTLTINGTTNFNGDINHTGSMSVSGNLTVVNDIFTSSVQTDDIRVDGNVIATTLSNSNLELRANGTGTIELQENTNVTGTLDVSSQATLASANVEDLTAGRVVLAGVNGELEDNANLTFNGTKLTVTGDQLITGNLDVTGDITLGGNIRIGDTTLDTVTVQADFTSDLIPNESNLYDLGTNSKQWRIINAAEFDNGVININDNVISTTVSNANLELRASGTGFILVPQNDVTISQALTVNGNTTLDVVTINDTLTVNAPSIFNDTVTINSDLTVTGNTTTIGNSTQQGNFTVTENLIVTGDIIGGPLLTDDIRIAGNRIETTLSNSNLELNTVGTGSIELQTDTNVTGALDVSGQTTLASANIEDLTSGRIVLAGANGELEDNANLTFNGTLLTVTGDVTVTGNIDSPTADITVLTAGEINVDGIKIDTTVISTTSSNADLVLDPSGTGIVYISGTGAVRIPAGTTFERPVTGDAGYIRYNSQTNNIEAWNGFTFAGISGGSSSDTNGDTLITFETGGNNEDIIRFFTGIAGETPGSTIGSVERVTISENGLTVDNNVRLQNNYIETTVSNSDLELRANGTGLIYVPTNNVEIDNDLTVNTATYLNTLDTSGQATLASANVEDLTSGRVVLAGVNGELEDSANLTFNGTLLTVTGNEEITGTLDVVGNTTLNYTEIDELLVSGKVRISGNVIENTVSDEDLIIRASGSGRVILDGAGGPGETGNVFATDPLLTLNSSQFGANTYDSGLIIERGSDINKAFIWDESADAFALVSTIEQGTVRGNVAITNYQDVHVASVKLTSESANKVTFTDADKIIRTVDAGEIAYVDGVIKFTTSAEAAIPTGTTAERPATPQEGTLRFNTTDLAFEGYAEGSWRSMGFGVGTAPTYQGFLANGVDFEFTLAQVPLSAAAIMVAINGVVQEPNIAYTVDGSILRFIDDTSTVVAPEVADRIDVRFLSMPAVTSVHTVNFTANGITDTFDTQFQIPNEECIMVFVNSVYQDTEVYDINGSEVTFIDETPALDDRINIVVFPTIIAPDLPTKTYVDQQITLVSNTATDDAIAFAIALG